MRHIVLRGRDRIQVFATALQARPDLGGHVLTVNLRADSGQYIDVNSQQHSTIERIFYLMPCVCAIRTSPRLREPFFQALSQLFQHMLTFLSMTVGIDFEAAIESIAWLRKLEALALRLSIDPTTSSTPLPLSLPFVRLFSMDIPQDANDHLWVWLVMCRFCNNFSLFLESRQRLENEQWLDLNSFFEVHACRFVMMVPWDSSSHPGSASRILSRAHQVDFGYVIVPDSALFSAARPPVNIWSTVSADYEESETEETEEIIRVLSKTPFTHDFNLHIRIWLHSEWQRAKHLLEYDGGRDTEHDTVQLISYIEEHRAALALRGVTVLYPDPDEALHKFKNREWLLIWIDGVLINCICCKCTTKVV
jgi:hypothetical protein